MEGKKKKKKLTLFLRRNEFFQCQHFLMQSIKSEAKIFLCVLLTTLRVKNQAISNNYFALQELTRECAHITVKSAIQ